MRPVQCKLDFHRFWLVRLRMRVCAQRVGQLKGGKRGKFCCLFFSLTKKKLKKNSLFFIFSNFNAYFENKTALIAAGAAGPRADAIIYRRPREILNSAHIYSHGKRTFISDEAVVDSSTRGRKAPERESVMLLHTKRCAESILPITCSAVRWRIAAAKEKPHSWLRSFSPARFYI